MQEDLSVSTKTVRKPPTTGTWAVRGDICVVGAGISGLSAALEAAKAGKRVVLVDSQPQLGGQTYSSLIGCFCGFYSNGKENYQFTHGIADDLFRDLKACGGLYENPPKFTRVLYYNETLFLRWAETKTMEAGVRILTGATIRNVNKEGRRITSVEAVTRYGDVTIFAEGFVDASGDAVIAWLAGMECNIPERDAVFGSEMFLLEGIDYSVPAPTEEELTTRMTEKAGAYGLVRKKGLMFYCQPRGSIAIGNMTHVDTPLDPLRASVITIEGKDQVDSVVRFLKAEFPASFSRSTVRAYGQTGIRQSRWIHGVQQLSVSDVRKGTKFEDAIARSAWPVELHNHGDGYIWEVFDDDHVHYIPLKSLLSEEADNYAACGRCIDADVAALSSVRVMGPCTATGAAAAHALILAGAGSVHDIEIGALQAILRDNLERRD